MSEQSFLKCPCQSCGGPIEFPAAGIGLRVECPHCGQKTLLSGASPEAAPSIAAPPAAASPAPAPAVTVRDDSRKRSPALLISVLLIAIAGLAGGAFWYFKGPRDKQEERAEAKMPSLATPGVASNGALPAIPASETKAPKSLDDLKPGAVSLEKAKSGNLFYAVGTVRNDSDHQRFGVKVEIEFTDARGRPAGKASDYTQVIEPRKEWRFRALVLDSKAVAGKVVALKEDN